MNKLAKKKSIFLISFILISVSCSTTNVTEEAVYDSVVSSVEVSVEDDKNKADEVYDYSSKAIMANAVVYFDFDQYTLSSKSIQTLRSIAQVMEDNKDLEITVSGHADERGTREYNLALGQRRGEAVRDYLLLNGISKNRITVKSYGEEYPLVKGSNESSWAKNRRAEIN
ncbi:MAG: peptidoglycan-associated lipoprotein [Gammaproteobacteria bacterium]|nr:peptidoglycan-associated lipoprotein [Gammaproteobacteria bacterium]